MGCCQAKGKDKSKIPQSNGNKSLSSELRYDWSDLPQDILRLASTKLVGIIDIIHLRVVCKNWCSAISPPALPPWVFLDDHHIPKSLNFLSLDRSDFCIDLPEVENMQLVGITYNYMVLLDETKNAMFLVNPITGKINPLPPFPQKYPRARFMEVDPVQSSNTIIIRSRVRLLICQPGDKQWKVVRVPFLFYGCAYFNGLYYIHELRTTLVYELSTGATVARLSHPLEIPTRQRFGNRFSYLIESFGELIGVCRNQRRCDSVEEYRFGIFRLNNEEGALNNKWVEVNTIEDRILLLSFRTGFCVRVNDFPGLEKNSIYFVSAAKCLSPPVSFDLCRYDIANGKTEKLKRVNSMLAYWFFPSLR